MKAIIMLMVVICATPAIVDAGKVHIWTDKEGVTHITDTPPPENKIEEIIDTIQESESHGSSRTARIERRENSAALNRLLNRYDRNDAIRESNRRWEDVKNLKVKEIEQRGALMKQREIDAARRDYEYDKSREERYKENYNSAYSRSSKLYWKERLDDIQKKRDRLFELQRSVD